MKIALSQLNVTPGALLQNQAKITEHIRQAVKEGADLLVCGEMSLCGAPLYDLVSVPGFLDQCRRLADELSKLAPTMGILLGMPTLSEGQVFNSAVYLYGGWVQKIISKNSISREEAGFYVPVENSVYRNVIEHWDERILVVVGDDLSGVHRLPCFDQPETTPACIVQLNALSFRQGIFSENRQKLSDKSRSLHTPLVHVNLAGGCTDRVYTGGSAVFDRKGRLVAELKEFEEDFRVVDLKREDDGNALPLRERDEAGEVYEAAVTGLRDYCRKAGFSSVCLGLSGGIDSAVVAAVAAGALGASHVHALMMPSPFSSEHSVYDAVELSLNLGIKCEKIEIGEIYDAFIRQLSPLFQDLPFSVAEENIQARIRCVLLMGVANKFGYLLLNTSNKSEGAVGYGTLYGDDTGGLSILGDLYKTDVYRLAAYINRKKKVIPQHIIDKAPSAELSPGQKDSDTLPPYEVLDRVLYGLIEENLPVVEVAALGFAPEMVERVSRMLTKNEYKRYQFCPTLRMSSCPLGQGRVMPVIHGYKL